MSGLVKPAMLYPVLSELVQKVQALPEGSQKAVPVVLKVPDQQALFLPDCRCRYFPSCCHHKQQDRAS